MTPGSNEKIAKVILQDVTVLAAGQIVEMKDNKPVTNTTVTLALTPQQVERLAVAQSDGRLMLVQRNLRDTEFVRTPGATPSSLLSDIATAPKPEAKPVTVQATAAPAAQKTEASPQQAPAQAAAPAPKKPLLAPAAISPSEFP